MQCTFLIYEKKSTHIQKSFNKDVHHQNQYEYQQEAIFN